MEGQQAIREWNGVHEGGLTPKQRLGQMRTATRNPCVALDDYTSDVA